MYPYCQRLFNEKMKDLRHLTWISIALSLFIGGIVTVLFLRRNYMPVQLIAKFIQAIRSEV